MKGPTSTVGCPKGHKSIDLVFCSVCGTPIGGPLVPEFGAAVTAANALEPDTGRGSGPTGPTGRSAARYLPGHGPKEADSGPSGGRPYVGGPDTGQVPTVGPNTGPVPHVGGPNTGPVPAVGGPTTGPVPHVSGPDTGPAPTVGPNTGPVPAVGGPTTGPVPHVSGPSTGPVPQVGGANMEPVPRLGRPNTGPVPHVGGPNAGPAPHVGSRSTGPVPHVGGPNAGPAPQSGDPLQPVANGASANGLAAHASGPSTGPVPVVDVAAPPSNGLGRYGDPHARPHSGPTGEVVRRGTPPGPPSGPGSGSPMGGPPPPARPSGGGVCPNCSAELDAGSRFCEVCGYDPTTGSLPQAPVVRPAVDPLRTPAPPPPPAAPPPPPPGQPPAPGAVRLVAVISADRAYYDSNHVSEVQFPLGVPPRAIELPAGPVSIGRRSRSRGTEPNIDLAGPPEDPAVSHTHASLLPSDDGRWELVDHGSTNGTYVNEAPQPIPANQPVPLSPGDRIYLGAWTRITLEIR